MNLEVWGKVFSGMGKGRYYVGHPEYQRKFKEILGYVPYPGTLNVKLEDLTLIRRLDKLRSTDGAKIAGFEIGGETFSALNCFDGKIGGEIVTLLFIEVTHYNDSVAELISPVYLREKFSLKDGDTIMFVLDVPNALKGR